MSLFFCTLFDLKYVPMGLAMYYSLAKHCNNFHLFIFPFDDRSFKILKNLSLESATVISLEEFEDEELLSVKPKRTKGEYYWTCASSTILYVLEKYNVESCTYLDADLYFYSSPEVLLKEIGNNSVMITEHKFTPEYDESELYGKYCVQFITFKNDEKGLEVLRWWRNACINWCYARSEDGKFGDQKYLDDWIERFEGATDLKHPGGGLAAWNIQQYNVFKNGDKLFIKKEGEFRVFEVVFYHFHTVKFNERYELSIYKNYKIPKNAEILLYKPYLQHLKQISRILNKNSSIIKMYKFPSPFKYKEFKRKSIEILKNVLKFIFRIKK